MQKQNHYYCSARFGGRRARGFGTYSRSSELLHTIAIFICQISVIEMRLET